MKFRTLPAPEILRRYVECYAMAEYQDSEALEITMCPGGLPGIVFQHHEGRSALDRVISPSGLNPPAPTLFIYGQTTGPTSIHHKKGPSVMTQVILKPHALRTVFGLNASALTNCPIALHEISTEDLNEQLIEARNAQKRIDMLTRFLLAKLKQTEVSERVVEESLSLIHNHIGSITVPFLLNHFQLSERQFERRFHQTVGISPHAYIRLKRFNEAIRLIKIGQYPRLTEIAHALNYYDQSHFIHDMRALSGIPPKRLSLKEDAFHGQAGYSYLSL